VIAIPLGFLFAQQMLLGLVPRLIDFLPWVLTIPPNNSDAPSIALAVMLGTKPATYLPLATALVASALFVAVALWAFQREEL
jgi:hypothetical protein